jgi:hypothetical protein
MNKEICYNLVNSLLAGMLVLLGALSAGNLDSKAVCAAIIAALIVAVTQFKRYWELEAPEYTNKILFGFVGVYRDGRIKNGK